MNNDAICLSQLEFEVSHVELFAHGLVMGVMESRPLLMLKGRSEDEVLTVWMSQFQMSLLLAEMGQAKGGERAHMVSLKILKALGAEITHCVFVDSVSLQQYVEIYFRGSDRDDTPGNELQSIRARADEAMSLCLAHKARFFATREFIERSRSLQLDSKDFGLTPETLKELTAPDSTLMQ